jgi:hypothetical protein
MMRRILAVVAIIVVAVAAVGGWFWWKARQPAAPEAPAAALDELHRLQPGAWHGANPQPGVYVLHETGRECAGVTGFSLCRNLPTTAQTIIARPAGDVLIENDLSVDHIEAYRLALRPAGAYQTWQRTKIVFAGIGQDDKTTVAPPSLSLPANPHVGQTWTTQFMAGGLPVHTTNRIGSATTVTVGGTAYPVLVITSVSVTGGAHPGTETDVSWHSTQLGVDLRDTINRKIGGQFPYTLVYDGTMVSTHAAK